MALRGLGGTFSVIGRNGSVPKKTGQGLSLAEAIERINAKKRGKGRLGPAAKRDKIAVSTAEAVPGTAATGGSIGSPWVEQYYDGSQGYYELVSSDGLFTFEFGAQTDYINDDGTGETITIKHRNPEDPPPTP